MLGAQYLAAVWARAQLPCAELCASDDAARVLAVTDLALRLARKPPLAPALLQRRAILDRIAREHAGPRIVEIAAGFSPRGAAMTRDRTGAYVEVDLPALIA